MHIDSQRLRQHAQGLHMSIRERARELKEEADTAPSPPIESHLKMKNKIIFYEGVSVWQETTLKDRPNAQHKMNSVAHLEGLWFTVLSRGPSFI